MSFHVQYKLQRDEKEWASGREKQLQHCWSVARSCEEPHVGVHDDGRQEQSFTLLVSPLITSSSRHEV